MAAYNAGKFNRELEKIETDGLKNYQDLYKTYQKLVTIIRDNNKSLQEQNDAYEELKRTFKDILPDQQLQIEYLKDTKNGYEQVEAAIYAKIRAQIKEQKANKIAEEYGDKIADREKKLTNCYYSKAKCKH